MSVVNTSAEGVGMNRRMTAVIQREKDGFVALCPELDIASQGDTVESARENLREAVQLFFECASPGEIQERLREDCFVTHVEVTVG
jgi:predicted RNase H-like HicB family nuclease